MEGNSVKGFTHIKGGLNWAKSPASICTWTLVPAQNKQTSTKLVGVRKSNLAKQLRTKGHASMKVPGWLIFVSCVMGLELKKLSTLEIQWVPSKEPRWVPHQDKKDAAVILNQTTQKTLHPNPRMPTHSAHSNPGSKLPFLAQTDTHTDTHCLHTQIHELYTLTQDSKMVFFFCPSKATLSV